MNNKSGVCVVDDYRESPTVRWVGCDFASSGTRARDVVSSENHRKRSRTPSVSRRPAEREVCGVRAVHACVCAGGGSWLTCGAVVTRMVGDVEGG